MRPTEDLAFSSHSWKGAFSGDLLSEAEDEELQFIVEEAARDLKVPIALVTLVLEHTQFFKAHYGLPEDLEISRGTSRDVSFCQFVVDNQSPFIIKDTLLEESLPQTFVRDYGVRAYLGVPIKSNDVIVGTLCVLDTKPREFNEEDQKKLDRLASIVNLRLAALASQKHFSRSLVQRAAQTALAELKRNFTAIKGALTQANVSYREISTFLSLIDLKTSGRLTAQDETIDLLSRSKTILEKYQNSIYDIEVGLDDSEDSVNALDTVINPADFSLLSEIAVSGRELARYNTRDSGGVLLPDLSYDPYISTSRPLAASLVSVALTYIANLMTLNGLEGKIKMASEKIEGNAAIVMISDQLSPQNMEDICKELDEHLGNDPSVRLKRDGRALKLIFAVAKKINE